LSINHFLFFFLIFFLEFKDDAIAIRQSLLDGDPNAKWHKLNASEYDPLLESIMYKKEPTPKEFKKSMWSPLMNTRGQQWHYQYNYTEKRVARLKEFEKKFILIEDFRNIPRYPTNENNTYCFVPGHGTYPDPGDAPENQKVGEEYEY
jgi:hypothetical protein